MNHYSLLYLLPATLEPTQMKETQKTVLDILTNHGGQIVKEYEPEKRKLSYPIKHVRHGMYINIDFDIERDKLDLLQQELKLNAQLLRFILCQEKTFDKKTRPVKISMPIKSSEPIKKGEKQDKKKEKKEKSKINLEELDKKIDEILDN